MTNPQNPLIGPDGKEWAKTKAGYEHVDAMLPRADGGTDIPYWHGWALRGAFVAGAEWQEQRALSNTAQQPNQGCGHPGVFAPQEVLEDWTVDRFAVVMKEKLAQARAKGRSGWNMPECTQQYLSNLLREHVDKGDPRDVANFCMFLWARGEAIAAAPQPAPERLAKPAKVGAGTFCAGVPERMVIEAAQRLYERDDAERKLSPEELTAQEVARRNLWEAVHGPLPISGNHPALPTSPQVADALLSEVAGCFTREDDLPNDLLARIDAYLTAEGHTE